MSNQQQQLVSLRDQLKAELSSPNANVQKCNQLLSQSKVETFYNSNTYLRILTVERAYIDCIYSAWPF